MGSLRDRLMSWFEDMRRPTPTPEAELEAQLDELDERLERVKRQRARRARMIGIDAAADLKRAREL